MGLDTVAFDMDGTLLNSGDFGVRAIEAAFAELMAGGLLPGLSAPPRPDAIRAQIGKPPHVFYRDLLPPALQPRAGELHTAVTRHERLLLQDGTGQLFPGALGVLNELNERGLKLLLISNCSPEYMDAVIETFALEKLFRFSSAVGRNPGLTKSGELRRGLAELGARRAVMVGDRVHDGQAARENGLSWIACAYGYGPPEELANADAIIHAITELPGLLHSTFSHGDA